MEQQVTDFSAHVSRVRRQYEESLKLKKNLPEHEVIVNMDFSENYSCRSVNEIQSAYWNQCSVTLHPVVVYYRSITGDLQHKSTVIVSDELSHNASTVLAFIDKIVPQVKKLVPSVKKVHYYTDSPTSPQYRNKTIFRAVANHEELYGCKAIWNYYEAGHGKGPCDGLGGTTKRMADQAVNSGSHHTRCRRVLQVVAVRELFPKECGIYVRNLHLLSTESYDIKAITGTMKIHAVAGKGNNTILTSSVSCYCMNCIGDQECTSIQWFEESLVVHEKVDDVDNLQDNMNESQMEMAKEPGGQSSEVVVGTYVAALYDKKVYIGKILEVDDEDNEVEITFMENVRSLLQWPKYEDKLWVDKSAIVCFVSDPVPTGKSKRMFKLNPTDLANIKGGK